MSWHTGATVKSEAQTRGIPHPVLAIDIGMASSGLYSHYKRPVWDDVAYITRAARVLGVNALWLQTGKGAKFPVDDPYSVKHARVERTLMLFKAKFDRELEDFTQHLLDQLRDDVEPGGDAPTVPGKRKRR